MTARNIARPKHGNQISCTESEYEQNRRTRSTHDLIITTMSGDYGDSGGVVVSSENLLSVVVRGIIVTIGPQDCTVQTIDTIFNELKSTTGLDLTLYLGNSMDS
ncbi:1498_t:CDS:2 [Gigaspora margarita]|uniref:1498_t:CDS:1 n=1 Tax=Gigaspora margarita TaxID=4874 RepID=A0ABN7UJC8_GIGMA|nr:1498_t:CDS:2 [Gigaspora margarita]